MSTTAGTARLSLGIVITVLILYSLSVVGAFHYERLTGDAALYMSIAEKYLQGDLGNAINGYWGPLLSWLLVPLLLHGASHVFAINALNLAFGILTIFGVLRLSGRLGMSEGMRMVILIPLAPVLLFISLAQPMDFLLLCILVYYLDTVFRDDYHRKVSHAVRAGILGALAYFSKPFGFPFFISHFLLMTLCHYLRVPSRENRKDIMRNALTGFLVFFLLSGVWIALISSKYGRLTFSNMGRGVFAALGPESSHDTLEKGDPIFFKGFFAPPNESAIVIYEDPSYARDKTWNPLASKRLFGHFMSNFIENVIESFRIYESFSRLSTAIVISCILLILVQTRKRAVQQGELLYPLLTVALYTAGYLPFHLETRYLWIVNILLLLLGGTVLTILFRHEFFKERTVKHVLTVLFVLSFVVTPAKSVIEMSGDNLNRDMHELGTMLSRQYGIKGNFASNRQHMRTTVHDSWHKTFRLAYWMDSRYFGEEGEHMSAGELERDLNAFGIDYYFYWEDEEAPPGFLMQYREVTAGEIPGLRIYSLREKG
ncbi:MAG: hypothetical protein JSU90_07680 [Nitrospiraceae bacterium]|nr:MAG: hypothetical protein JSU90_07680 [Nitrospiraceae bacterium]